ncbi:MAG: alpha/beta fold hydrolase [Sphaerochaetaceae bacterium]|nr:alpha/beta fold hydrolase [Spirochaetales bacterium]MDY5499073.1 alpha/beta fold hydrolase [Sphaerochaetaceae bacterium]
MQDIPATRPRLDPSSPYCAIVRGWYDYGSFLLFVPEGSALVQATVFLAGVTMDKLGELGWMEVMERRKANYVVVRELDADSFFSIKSALQQRRTINPYSSAFYLVAFGDAAEEASLLAARYPQYFAGIALLGSSAGYEELSGIGRMPAPEEDHPLDMVPLPLWANPTARDALAYWKRVNGCFSLQGNRYETIRRPDEDRDLGADIIVDEGNDLQRMLDFLFEKRRFPGLRDGNLRDADLPEAIGAQRHEACFDGFNRLWYTYIPKHEEGKRLPLVLVLHGRGGEGGEFIARSGWRHVSDEAGCITVYPTGASGIDRPITYWNFFDHGKTPLFADDCSFLSQLVDRLCSELPVDPKRIYLSGQSMGSMMSMAMALAYPDHFAASASSAGLLPGFMEHLSQIALHPGVPLRVSLGEFDALAQSNDPERNDAVRWFLGTLHALSGLGKPEISRRGPDVDYVCRDGQGQVRLWYTRVKGKTHAILPSEAKLFWQWMRDYRLGR